MKRLLICGLLVVMFLVAGFGRTASANDTPVNTAPAPFVGHPACAGVTLQTPSTPECEAFMASRPAPANLGRIPVDLGIIQTISLAMYVAPEVTVYDAPGGSVIETFEPGYQYVAPSSWNGDWVEVDPGRWVERGAIRFTRASDFSGVTINGGLDMPFAWVLWRLDASSGPAGLSDRENGRYNRYQLVNIFATVNVSGWDWHLVGPGHWIMQKNLSIVYPTPPAEVGGNWVAVNVFEQNLVAWSGGTPVMATLISSGVKNGRWDTPTGTFSIHNRVEAGTMNGAEGAADFYSLEFVPYAQYFNGQISLHGTYWHDSFGYPHSHGCVNMTVSDAKWMFDWIGVGGTVHVYSGQY